MSALKWSGSKRKQAKDIVAEIRKVHIEQGVYYEPFCGGCSVLLEVLKAGVEFQKYICSDVNKDVIAFWKEVQGNPGSLINRSTHTRDFSHE